MKKIILMLFFTVIFLSCEKDYMIPPDEVPNWLKADINKQEQIIKDSPKYMAAYGAWLRYEWQNEYYFEYHNPLSSSSPRAISVKGDTLNIYANDVNTDYYQRKCCKAFVWKAPKFSDFPDK